MKNPLSMTDGEIEEFMESLQKEEWSNNKECNDFLNFTLNYVDGNGAISSEEFLYDRCSEFSSEKFDELLFALWDKINNYGVKNHLSAYRFQEDLMFIQGCYYLKIKEKFYLIECLEGQGTAIVLTRIDNIGDYPFVDYELMMEEKESPLKEKALKEEIFSKLDLLMKDYSGELNTRDIINILNSYIDCKENKHENNRA